MANTRSAAKRARQTTQRTLRNKSVLTGLKGQQKKLTAAVASGDSAKAQVELNILASRLDKAAKRGIVHKNLANRRKSRAAKGGGSRRFGEGRKRATARSVELAGYFQAICDAAKPLLGRRSNVQEKDGGLKARDIVPRSVRS